MLFANRHEPKPFLLLASTLGYIGPNQAHGAAPYIIAGADVDPASLRARAAALPSLDRFPVPVLIVPPVFPEKLGQVSDRVVVTFFIDEKGSVIQPAVLSGTNSVLRDAALTAVAQWHFEPPTRRGVPTLVAASQAVRRPRRGNHEPPPPDALPVAPKSRR